MNFSSKNIYEKTIGAANKNIGEMNRKLASVQFRKAENKLGIIESTFVADGNLYAIIRRVPTRRNAAGHESNPLFNNILYVEDDKLSAMELYIPITNIDLSITVVDPKELVGKYAMVTLLGDNKAIKAEYTGNVKDPSKGPLSTASTVLYNARMKAGATLGLLDEKSAAKPYLEQMLGLNAANKELLELSYTDVLGKSVRIEGDGTYSNSTSKPTDNELVIEDTNNLVENKNGEEMKARDCHLPILLFTGR